MDAASAPAADPTPTRPATRAASPATGASGQNGQATKAVASDTVAEHIGRLRENINRVFLGHPRAVDLLIIALLARGHALLEDVPGVGKTTLAKALARSIDGQFSRIQLTPDLLPADLLGVSVFNGGTGDFEFKPGPIFANIVLADEVNRTTPRTQSALLEAMAEGQVSIESRTYNLPPPFMVVATQNPFEFEGTYMLPENQLDRFLLKIGLGYPGREAERRLLATRPGEEALSQLQPVLGVADVVALQVAARKVRLEAELHDYLLDLVEATRTDDRFHLGVSPRGALALLSAVQAKALLEAREYATPDDVKSLFRAVCGHRVIPRTYLHDGDATAADQLLGEVLTSVAAPG